MIRRAYDCLRKRRCEVPKPVARVTGVWIRYLPDVKAGPGPPPGAARLACTQSKPEKGVVVMPLLVETLGALIEYVQAGTVRTE